MTWMGHRVNWVSWSHGSWVTGSLGHKMWPSSMSDEYYVTVHVCDPEVLLMWLVRLFEYAAVKWILARLWSLADRITNYSVANLEVAERHAWKGHVTLVLGTVLVRDQIAHHVVAERVVQTLQPHHKSVAALAYFFSGTRCISQPPQPKFRLITWLSENHIIYTWTFYY